MTENNFQNGSKNQENIEDSLFLEKEEWYRIVRGTENAFRKVDEEGVDFGRLEVQIATVFLAFSTLGSFVSSDVLLSLFEKWLLVVGWSSLVFSLLLGLLSSHIKQKFWDADCDKWMEGQKLYRMKLSKRITEDVFQDMAIQVQKRYPERSPNWAWYLQTGVLVFGILCLHISFISIIL